MTPCDKRVLAAARAAGSPGAAVRANARSLTIAEQFKELKAQMGRSSGDAGVSSRSSSALLGGSTGALMPSTSREGSLPGSRTLSRSGSAESVDGARKGRLAPPLNLVRSGSPRSGDGLEISRSGSRVVSRQGSREDIDAAGDVFQRTGSRGTEMEGRPVVKVS
jgi:hypothetical protein